MRPSSDLATKTTVLSAAVAQDHARGFLEALHAY
jgi:hypothetical protein